MPIVTATAGTIVIGVKVENTNFTTKEKRILFVCVYSEKLVWFAIISVNDQ